MFRNGKIVALIALATGLADQAPANEFRAVNRVRVAQVNSEIFEVIDGRMNVRYWCAAGDYARRKLKTPWDARIYVARGEGPSETTNRRFAIQFTTMPDKVGVTPTGSGASDFDLNVGANLTVTQAFGNCDDHSLLSQR